jgi:hypothetical protein
VFVVKKWPLLGRIRFLCWTRVSLWLLCNVHFVQSTQRTRLQTGPFVRGINNLLKLGVCASRNQVVDAPMLTRVWQELEYRIDMCRVTRGAHIEHL